MHKEGIDVVVVNYKTTSLLNNFIDSYNKSSFYEKDLFIVDNDPDENDVDINKGLSKNAFYMYCAENIGYAKACNLASKISKGFSNRKYIAFFNSDCVLLKDTLEKMYEGMENNNLSIAGPLQYNRNYKVTAAGIFGSFKERKDRGWRSANLPMFRDMKKAVSISGSAYFIRRDVWEELSDCPIYKEIAPNAEGAFLPTRHYFEETWCSYHAQAHGYDVTYYGLAEMIHEWHKSSKVGGHVEKEIFPESKELFVKACDMHSIEHD